jgi:hypothetical protein
VVHEEAADEVVLVADPGRRQPVGGEQQSGVLDAAAGKHVGPRLHLEHMLLVDEEAGFLGYWYTYDDRQECVHPDFASGMSVPCGGESCAASGDATKTDPPTAPYGEGQFAMRAYAAAGVDAPTLEGKQKKNEWGIRITGGGNTYFGAGVGVGLNNPGTLQAKDISMYTGLRFLAKSGDGEPIRLRVKIKDAFSEPFAGNCINRQNVCTAETCQCCDGMGKACEAGSAGTLTQGCHDDPTAPVAATAVSGTEWKLYEIGFDDFVSEGWGSHLEGQNPADTGLDTTQAYQVQFQVQTDATPATSPLAPFDLWLDNIGFVTGALQPPPAGMQLPTDTPQ